MAINNNSTNHGHNQQSNVLLLNIGLIILFLVSFLAAVVANVVVLVVFTKKRSLRSTSNRFVINLVASNLALALSILPLVLSDLIVDSHGQSNSVSFSVVADTVMSSTVAVSILSTLLIAIDRYCAVTDPLHYSSRITKLRASLSMTSVWVISILLAAIVSLPPACSGMWSACCDGDVRWRTSPVRTYQKVSTVLFTLVVFLLPVISLCLLYGRIYAAAHENSQRNRRNSSQPQGDIVNRISVYHQLPNPQHGGVQGADLQRSLQNVKATSSKIASRKLGRVELPADDTATALDCHTRQAWRNVSNNLVSRLKHTLSNASLFRYREESKTAKISVLVVMTVCICFGPYFLASLFHKGLMPSGRIPPVLDLLAVLLCMCNGVVSPFIYAYRSRRLRREIWWLFCPKTRGTLPGPILQRRWTTAVPLLSLNEAAGLGKPRLEQQRKSLSSIFCYEPPSAILAQSVRRLSLKVIKLDFGDLVSNVPVPIAMNAACASRRSSLASSRSSTSASTNTASSVLSELTPSVSTNNSSEAINC